MLKEYMRSFNLTVEYESELTGVPVASIRTILAGKKGYLRDIKKLAEGLGVDEETIYDFDKGVRYGKVDN